VSRRPTPPAPRRRHIEVCQEHAKVRCPAGAFVARQVASASLQVRDQRIGSARTNPFDPPEHGAGAVAVTHAEGCRRHSARAPGSYLVVGTTFSTTAAMAVPKSAFSAAAGFRLMKSMLVWDSVVTVSAVTVVLGSK